MESAHIPTKNEEKQSHVEYSDEKINQLEQKLASLEAEYQQILVANKKMEQSFKSQLERLSSVVMTGVTKSEETEAPQEFETDEIKKMSIQQGIANGLATVGPTGLTPLKDIEVFIQQQKELNREWFYTVGVDLGATNSRVSLNFFSQSGKEPKYFRYRKSVFLCKCPVNTASFFYFWLEQTYNKVKHLVPNARAGVIAAAGPVSETKKDVIITNYASHDTHIFLDKCPPEFFPPNKSMLLGDVEACCFGIVGVDSQNKLHEYFERVHLGEGKQQNKPVQLRNHHYGVLAVGTGLGAGYILSQTHREFGKSRDELRFDVIPLELGHVTVPHCSEKSKKIFERIEYLTKQLYGYRYAPEFEDIVSGRGIKNCYSFEMNINVDDCKLSAEQIAKTVDDSEKKTQALMAYFHYLMKAAQNMCIMTPNTTGVFLCGDNQVNNLQFFKKHEKLFHDIFFDHPKKAWLQSVSFYNQLKAYNFNLEGVNFFTQIFFLADTVKITKKKAVMVNFGDEKKIESSNGEDKVDSDDEKTEYVQ